ncbi:hypothetical protein H4S06_006165, partial [Coemansia sp. BCRC 34490]
RCHLPPPTLAWHRRRRRLRHLRLEPRQLLQRIRRRALTASWRKTRIPRTMRPSLMPMRSQTLPPMRLNQSHRRRRRLLPGVSPLGRARRRRLCALC